MSLKLSTVLKANMLGDAELIGTSLSFATADKSINDAEGRLLKAGFKSGATATITNATTAGNNITSVIVSVTATKMILTDALGLAEIGEADTAVNAPTGGDLASLLSGGSLQLRSGTQNDDPDDAAKGTLLATIIADGTTTMDEVLDGTLSKDSDQSWTVNAVETGVIGHFRLIGANAALVAEGDAGTSGGILTLNSVATVSGKPVTVDTCVFTLS